jgi:hypothetical protein
MPGGLDPETIARLVAHHGSLSAAVEKARHDPRFAEEFRMAVWGQQLGDEAERRAATAEFYGLVAAWDRVQDETHVEGSGAFLPFTLIEKALRRHIRDGCGRRTLAAAFPGLTEWTARQLLHWYAVGEPNGLWLDEEGRVQVGASFPPTSPTRDGVRLPPA